MARYRLTRNYNGHYAGTIIEVTQNEGIMTKLGYGIKVADDYQDNITEVNATKAISKPQKKMVTPKYKRK